MHRVLNILWIYLICIILTAALFFHTPCPLCLMQRLAMLGIGSCALLNLRYGIQAKHYGMAIFFALLGHYIGLHLRPVGTFFLGLSLPTWSSIVFSCSLIASAVLLFFFRDKPPEWAWPEKIAFGFLLFVTSALTITSI